MKITQTYTYPSSPRGQLEADFQRFRREHKGKLLRLITYFSTPGFSFESIIPPATNAQMWAKSKEVET
jgi:hypothetical protein